jgi:hypothetical protein
MIRDRGEAFGVRQLSARNGQLFLTCAVVVHIARAEPEKRRR